MDLLLVGLMIISIIYTCYLGYELQKLRDQIADVHTILSIDSQTASVEEHVAPHLSPELTEDLEDFDTRIMQIKNELGLRAKVPDAHGNTEASILHPNVYNISDKEHVKYQERHFEEYAD